MKKYDNGKGFDIMSKYFCTLCGKKSENIRDLTKDHVPAKCLYRDPTGLQLNSVPTCFECNNGYKHRDEEFAKLIGIKASNGNSISGNAFFQERVRPMFRNNMAKGRSILKRVKNRLGFYMFQLTADELNNFLRDSPVKIIKSFYRKFTGRYLETDCIKKIRFFRCLNRFN